MSMNSMLLPIFGNLREERGRSLDGPAATASHAIGVSTQICGAINIATSVSQSPFGVGFDDNFPVLPSLNDFSTSLFPVKYTCCCQNAGVVKQRSELAYRLFLPPDS